MTDENTEEATTFNVSNGMAFLTAVQFLTRIPVQGTMNGTAEFYSAALRKSVVFFPLVGACIGLATALVMMIASTVFSPWIAVSIAVGLEACLTGAFHEDAFADTWDALGGGWTRERVLEIMKDSRLGTYGTIALVLGVGTRIAATTELVAFDFKWAVLCIIAASTIGRIAILVMMATTSPITDRDSQAKDVAGTQSGNTLLAGAGIAFLGWIGWIAAGPGVALIGLLASAVVLFWFRRKVIARVGGTTGDLLGCSAFLIQLVILIASTWGLSDA
jgi:adenosylcobinamide-GDP ribazoletransferase